MQHATRHGHTCTYESDNAIQVSYVVETTRNDERADLYFSNIHTMTRNTLGEALYIAQEWIAAGFNNVHVMTQIKQNGRVIFEDTASDFAPTDSKLGRLAHEAAATADRLASELLELQEFVSEMNADRLFEDWQQKREAV